MRFAMGRKPGGGGFVRVMKNDEDDPVTTPSSDRAKFVFDSEVQKLGYLEEIFQFNYLQGYPTGWTYWPSGTNYNSAWHEMLWQESGQIQARSLHWPRHSVFANLQSFPPIVEARVIARDHLGYYNGPRVRYTNTDEASSGSRCGHHEGGPGWNGDLSSTVYAEGSNRALFGGGWQFTLSGLYTTSDPTNRRTKAVAGVWDLPADSSPIPGHAASPVPGQKIVHLSRFGLRIAKGGYDVDSAPREGLILDSNKIPAKLIASGEIQVNEGASHVIALPVPVDPATTYMDYHIKETFTSAPMCHPPMLESDPGGSTHTGFRYAIGSTAVTLTNDGDRTLTIRYMIFSDDAAPWTSGGSQVLRRVSAGGRDHIQIKRPGSSDAAPNMNDVVLDTRFPYLTILAEGWLGVNDLNEAPQSDRYGERAKTIWFEPGGLIPMVKHMVTFPGRISAPVSRVLRTYGGGASSPFNGKQAVVGSPAIIGPNFVKFHLAPNRPERFEFEDGTQFRTIAGDNPIGLRFYIFGVPPAL
ncbi:MAG TPA: hypothetical protein VGN97_21870 [Mesorhizobium sp.]|jgi:hypothetical protein|nr:hypothetical protein [Mesorhizobium sp.]